MESAGAQRRKNRERTVRPTECVQAESASETQPEVKNLIYMIGDGMGLAHVSMLQIAEGYDHPTAFMRAENIALIKNYSSNNRVTDSAASGTALATGHKTNNRMLGMTPDSAAVESIIARAVKRDMPTGLVVTCHLGHATPGAFYAHVSKRTLYDAIYSQFVESGIDVALGGGAKYFDAGNPEGAARSARLAEQGYRIVRDLADADTIRSGRLVGLFADDSMPYALEERGEEYLGRATAKALEILDNNARRQDRGFVLMVEGSMIDYAAHENSAEKLLPEMRDFERAVEVAMAFVDAHPGTLLVVTSDHETGGLSLPSGHTDFTRSESGVEYRFSTESHTGIMLPVYLYGAGAERINGVLENSELSVRLMELLGVR